MRKFRAEKLTCGGGSIKWNCSKSWTPRDLSSRTVFAKFVRWISGTVVTSSSSLNCFSVYILKRQREKKKEVQHFEIFIKVKTTLNLKLLDKNT